MANIKDFMFLKYWSFVF